MLPKIRINTEGGVFQFFGRMGSLMILNGLFLLSCLPVVTMGAAFSAMSAVCLKLRRGEEPSISKAYWSAFRSAFRQATLFHLFLLLCGVLLYVDFSLAVHEESAMPFALRVIICLMSIYFVVITSYVYPLIAQFENKWRYTLRNACLLSAQHPLRTILICILNLSGPALLFLWPMGFVMTSIFWVMIGFSLIAYLNAGQFVSIFAPYVDEPEE